MNRATHFIGFRGNEFISAIRVWGKPDFFHRVNDDRVAGDVAPKDVVVFANREEGKRRPFVFNDSEHF